MITNNEIWKDIKGYNGKYQISNMGNVKSMWRNNQYKSQIGTPKTLKKYKHKQGYMVVFLTNNGETKQCFIHRLVAEAFIPNPDNLPQVNHKNEIKNDNRVENLEWCTGKYNSNYGTRVERHKTMISKPIMQFTLDGIFVKEYKSATEASKETGYNASYIRMVCNGTRPQAYNYKWINLS